MKVLTTVTMKVLTTGGEHWLNLLVQKLRSNNTFTDLLSSSYEPVQLHARAQYTGESRANMYKIAAKAKVLKDATDASVKKGTQHTIFSAFGIQAGNNYSITN